jgi:hypothetical protein
MELVITSHLEIIQLDNLVNLSLEKVPTNTTSAYCCYNIDDDKVTRHKYDGLSILYKLFILLSSMSLVFSSVDNLFETHLFYKRSKSIKSIAFCVIKNEKWFFIKSEHFNIQRTTHKYWAAPVSWSSDNPKFQNIKIYDPNLSWNILETESTLNHFNFS